MKQAILLFFCGMWAILGHAQNSLDSLRTVPLNERDYLAVSYQFDHFNKDIKPFNTVMLEYQNKLKRWTLVSRAQVSNRFGVNAWYAEQDVFKKFKSKDYLFVQVGFSPYDVFSRFRFTGEYYRAFAEKWEFSAGAKYLQFQDSIHVYMATGSLSKYSGRFLTILRVNGGVQNSATPNVLNASLQQRFYHSDNAYSALIAGYGVDPNTAIFSNNPSVELQKNTIFNVGIKTVQELKGHWFLQGQVEFHHLNFGSAQRNQMMYELKAFYTW